MTLETTYAHSSLANNAYLNIKPAANVEWFITNLYCGGAWEFYMYDGTSYIARVTGVAGYFEVALRCTAAYYYALRNVSGGAAYFGYDGIVYK